MPDGADLPSFVLSDGKRTAKPEPRPEPAKALTLEGLFQLYVDTLPQGSREVTTRTCEDIHIRHLKRHIPTASVAQSLTVADLQKYADARAREKWRGKVIGPDTIRKELATFRLIWNRAAERGHLAGPAPVRGVRLAKPDEKPPFMTWEEIETSIGRGGKAAHEAFAALRSPSTPPPAGFAGPADFPQTSEVRLAITGKAG